MFLAIVEKAFSEWDQIVVEKHAPPAKETKAEH